MIHFLYEFDLKHTRVVFL